jgi:hypothetical protein
MVNASKPQSVKIFAIAGGWHPCGACSLTVPRTDYWRSQLPKCKSTAESAGRTNSVSLSTANPSCGPWTGTRGTSCKPVDATTIVISFTAPRMNGA